MTKTTHAKMDAAVLERPEPTVGPVTMANERRQAWARSRDSIGQGSKADCRDSQRPQEVQSNGDAPSQDTGQIPSKIDTWLIDCRTPLEASLDDQNSSPTKGVKSGCSFEDDLSLGDEALSLRTKVGPKANHLQPKSNQTEDCFDILADQKRTQYKEKGRSMNSTGSGKSSTVSSVSELLDMYEEDPEEILYNLGFGEDEPDLSSKIPPRFFSSLSSARGIDIKIFLGAQLQRMELENPNYALTSRFRQIEVFTKVANGFLEVYSHVSGQPVNRFVCKDQGGNGGQGEQEGNGEEQSSQKKNTPAKAMAKLLRKISRNNMLGSISDSPEGVSPNQNAPLNGQTASPELAHVNGHPRSATEHDRSSTNSGHQVEMVSQKHSRRKDNFPLATVTEEASGPGESDRLTEKSPEQSSTAPEHQPDSADLHSAHQKTEREGDQVAKQETNLTSTPEKALFKPAPPHLIQLRTENADSFDMEEIHTNDDEAPSSRTSRTTDLSRTVSQQSDSSGFAEEPSGDSSSYLKVQESCDSCDSETTVTSHPSQDVATPQPLDQQAFDLPDGKEDEAGPAAPAKTELSGSSTEEEVHKEGLDLEQVPHYTVHQLPTSRLAGEGEQLDGRDRTDADTEPQPDQAQSMPACEREHQHGTESSQNPPVSGQEPQRTEGAEEKALESGSVPPVPLSPVLSALNRAKKNQLREMGKHSSVQSDNPPQTTGGRPGRGGAVRMQRSCSLPCSLLSPSKVVSSVRIQFGQGQAFCTPPRYSFKYTQRDGEQMEDAVMEEKDEGEQSNCLSTLIINPGSKEKAPASIPPKLIPRHPMQSSMSLHTSSPPPDFSLGPGTSWSTQSVPDLSSSHQQPSQFPLSTHQNQQNWSPGHTMFPKHSDVAPGFQTSPFPSPGSYPYAPYHYISPPYVSNQHEPSNRHYSSLTSLHQPATPPAPPYGSLINLHQPHPSSAPHILGLGPLAPGTPPLHLQGYNASFSHPLPFPAPLPGHQFGSPYYGTQGYNVSPHLHPGLPPIAATGSGPGRCPSSTEMQLRKVLHEIRGTVQSLGQSRISSPDLFGELRASQQSLAEFQQKRRSLNMFRSQMMDLELSIMRQQAAVYKHLSPADRMEAEELQCLRSAVREELQELEQQLEDRLLDLSPHSRLRSLHRDNSVESLSTTSALRAMEPVSDLLREQFFLQSELGYEGRGPSSVPSTRSPSPVRRREGEDGRQKQGVYRASINITPAPPGRPNAHTERVAAVEEEEGQRDGDGVEDKGGERDTAPGREGELGKLGAANFQQLIREIRESVAQEVRREIYNELLAAASPQGSSVSGQQHPA
ncbi:protein ITPRID2 [Fundulus heteroclitus]|uniref:protein ITPRID2 n=1 Tax=Fundulus heteroclitus TaxID=8078 RepID=UPI00165B10D8|nr:protein ITPRID2 [Fundulus heteroclitus]XP_012719813.2 protein ITPRID2 [Fundulus heteroclitus]XP_021173035.2 protein ITPRID2 [Fundulus heteroclitus]XP_021173036.2 protein ITPRID2 [Fundulus heteroclitus]